MGKNGRDAGTISLSVRATVVDKDGKVVRRTRWRRSRSFVLQFLEILYANLGEVNYSITWTTGAEDTWTLSAAMNAKAPAGTNVAGIVVGTGTTTPANTDYCITTIIAHGSGSGQLLHGAQAFTAPAVIGANVDLIGTRTFTNNSGATITIREVGIYAGEATYSSVPRCIAHDLLTVSVTNGSSVTIEYRLRTTV